jgi:hypothetical protein
MAYSAGPATMCPSPASLHLFICRPENASSAACTYPAKSGKVHRPARAKIDLPRPRTGALIGLAIFPNQLAFPEAG